MEQMKTDKNSLTFIGLLFIAYISATSCLSNNIVLYGGYAALMVFAGIKLLFGDGGKLIVTPYSKRMFLFVGYCFLGILWAYDREMSAVQLPLLGACVIMMIVMSDYYIKRKEVKPLFWVIAIAGFALSIYVIVEYGGISSFYEQATAIQGSLSHRRLGGDIKNPNAIGMQCGYATVILFFFALIKKKYFCYVLLLVPFAVTAASGSRKALLMLVIGFVMVFYYKILEGDSSKRYIKVYFGFFAVIIAIAAVFSLDIMNTAVERMIDSSGMLSGAGSDNSTTERLNMIIVGLKQYWKKPVIGWGIANSRIVNAAYLGVSKYSHNDYIELMLNGGLVGMLLYYGMIVKMIKEHIAIIKVNKRDDDAVLSFILLILFLAMNMACVTYYNSIPSYVYLTLWITLIEIKKEGLTYNESAVKSIE